jgi:hypothetical protein
MAPHAGGVLSISVDWTAPYIRHHTKMRPRCDTSRKDEDIMAMIKGMDVEQVRQFGMNLQNNVKSNLEQLIQQAGTQVQGLRWEGPDAQQFKGDRWQQVVNMANQLGQQLAELGNTAVMNANAQETTSAS